MMKKLRLFVVVIAIFMGVCGCGEDYVDLGQDGIAGRWKLTKIIVWTADTNTDDGWEKADVDTTYYYNDSIIYDFQCNWGDKVEDHAWSPRWKLVVDNYVPTGLPGDVKRGGGQLYQYYFFVEPMYDGMPPATNLTIHDDGYEAFHFACSQDYMGNMSFGPFRWIYPPLEDEDGNYVTWIKEFVKI